MRVEDQEWSRPLDFLRALQVVLGQLGTAMDNAPATVMPEKFEAAV
jgi:hypothetical protein